MEARMNGDVWLGIGIGFVATNLLHLVVGLCIVAARADRKLERAADPDDPGVVHLHAERPFRGHHTQQGARET